MTNFRWMNVLKSENKAWNAFSILFFLLFQYGTYFSQLNIHRYCKDDSNSCYGFPSKYNKDFG